MLAFLWACGVKGRSGMRRYAHYYTSSGGGGDAALARDSR